MRILKMLFGYCTCKGCKNKYLFNVDIKIGNKKRTEKLCQKHAKELISLGTIKSVTQEQTTYFN